MRLGFTAWLVLVVLVVDAVILALVELLFLPLRLPVDQGGRVVPVSILVAAVTTPLMVATAARLSPRMAVAGAPLAAWMLTIFTLGLVGPGGDVMLPGNARALLLIAAGVLPCGVVLGRMAATAATAAVVGPAPGPASATGSSGAGSSGAGSGAGSADPVVPGTPH